MKEIKEVKKWLASFLKNIREGPPKPPDMGICAHCAGPFERPKGIDIEPEVECRHYPGTTEYIFRYTNTRQIKIMRRGSNEQYALIYLELCEFCFLLKPRFAYLKLGDGGAVSYIWENENGGHYERHDYGKGLPPQNSD